MAESPSSMASLRRSHSSSTRGSRGPVGTGHGAAHRAGAHSPGSQRELLWDAIRAVAIVRVLAWHAWGWSPLSWFAAMPAMFFVAGVLLAQSIERHGFHRTLTTRLRRLLVPFAAYSAAALGVMVALGWRPDAGDLVNWVFPLLDPVGSAESPGLWIPLWYLRAYLWFVLAAGAIAAGARRIGWLMPLALCGVLVIQQRALPDLPMAVEDFIAYSPFVASGMVVAFGRLPSARASGIVAGGSGAVVAALMASGRASVVVNADYTVTVLAGAATLGLLIAAAHPLRAVVAGRASRVVGWISSRSLSVYLWQGLGLFAADALITQRGVGGVAGAVAVGMVVAAVTLSAATAAGWLEDLAARRTAWAPGRTSATGAVLAVAALAAAMVLSPASGSAARLPPSGRAVVDNAARVEAEVAAQVAGGDDEPARTVVDDLPAVLDAAGAAERERRLTDMVVGFTSRHQAELETAGATFFDLAVVTADGQEISLRWDAATGTRTVAGAAELAWFSITKSATAGWLMRLAAQGVVDVDDPVGRYLPQVPHGDDITLDHLARHQSGIPGSFDSDWLTANIGEDARTWIRSGELAFDPGTRHAYSRVGYTLLAWALEEASGVTWQEAMRTMASEAGAGATFVIDEERSPAGTENRHPGTGRYVGSAWAAGGLISEPLDLARFFHWLYRDGLGESSVAALSTVPVSSEFSYYGAGVMVSCPCEVDSEMVRPEFIGHGAATGFFFHHVPTGTTLAIVPQRAMDENGFIDLFFDGELALGVVDALAAPAVGTPRQSLLLRRS